MANKKKYLEEDFIEFKSGKVSDADLMKKYGVSKATLRKALNRRNIKTRSRAFIIHTPCKTVKCCSISEICDELKVSRQTIYNYLNGMVIKSFVELGVELEEVK